MSMQTLIFNLPDDTVDALDRAASAQHRDRSTLLHDALEQYLAIDDYHRAEIEAAIKEADQGELVDHEVVVARHNAWKVTRSSR